MRQLARCCHDCLYEPGPALVATDGHGGAPHDAAAISTTTASTSSSTDEERMIRGTVRSFVEREALPLLEGCHAREEFPRQLIPRMAELGIFGAHLKGYGCAGLSSVAYGLICRSSRRATPASARWRRCRARSRCTPSGASGSEEQKQRWLPEMAAGRAIGCFGLTEPDHGSDPGGMETRARRDGNGLGALGRQALDHQRHHRRRRDRLGEGRRDDPRLPRRDAARRASRRPTSRASSRCARRSRRSWCSRTCACRRGASCPRPRGSSGPFSCLNQARYGIVWGAIGAARTCYLTALDYAQDRTQFDRPLAGFQLVQQKLVTW